VRHWEKRLYTFAKGESADGKGDEEDELDDIDGDGERRDTGHADQIRKLAKKEIGDKSDLFEKII